jgi:hypothetical protein
MAPPFIEVLHTVFPVGAIVRGTALVDPTDKKTAVDTLCGSYTYVTDDVGAGGGNRTLTIAFLPTRAWLAVAHTAHRRDRNGLTPDGVARRHRAVQEGRQYASSVEVLYSDVAGGAAVDVVARSNRLDCLSSFVRISERQQPQSAR